jgi:LmbE family N-acetylglucosaminyl deacetylase
MRVIAAFAHPDDETILIGGTLAMLAGMGAEINIVSATRGEGGEVGEPPLCSREQLGKVRESELRCAAEELGARSLTFLGYVDPPVSVAGEGVNFSSDMDDLADQLAGQIRRRRADVIITHGSNGEYGHPAHRAMFAAARRTLNRVETKPLTLYCVSAQFEGHPRPHLANPDQSADLVIDIGPWMEAKLAAARCHRTQNALFVRRSSQEAGRQLSLPEVLMPLESIHRAGAANSAGRPDPLGDFLRRRCAFALVFQRQVEP